MTLVYLEIIKFQRLCAKVSAWYKSWFLTDFILDEYNGDKAKHLKVVMSFFIIFQAMAAMKMVLEENGDHRQTQVELKADLSLVSTWSPQLIQSLWLLTVEKFISQLCLDHKMWIVQYNILYLTKVT